MTGRSRRFASSRTARNKPKPVEPRHHHVGDKQIRFRGPRGLERRLAVRDGFNLIAPIGQQSRRYSRAGRRCRRRAERAARPGLPGGAGSARRHIELRRGRAACPTRRAGQPAQRLLDERLRARDRGNRRSTHRRCAPSGRWRAAERNLDWKARAAAEFAFDADFAAVLFDEFLNQRQARCRSPRSCALPRP